MIGRVFGGRYQLVEFIGKGGMAIVFRATDTKTGHDVAVKILRPEFNQDKEFLDRFQREALAASKMSHHNIVNLLDMGKEEGAEGEGAYNYIVMEYMRGRTLKEVIDDNGSLSEPVAGQIAIRILSAMQHAHSNGIIHRDIKPQNILVNAEGMIKVSDFGIARVAGSDTLTKKDSVMGSVYYFSPEQAQGLDVTYSSDLYSVGVVMYEMLTGRLPFDGDTPVSIAMQHVSAQPKAPSLLREGISPAMEQVVLTAMGKSPQARYRDAAEMARAIRAALNNPTDVDTSATPVAAMARRTEQGASALGSKRKKKKRLHDTVFLALMTVLVLSILGFGVAGIIRGIINSTEAPYLVGETEADAIRLGRDKGLKIEVIRQSDNKVEAGVVIVQSREYQYPMKRGDVLVITVSTGPEQQAVPLIKGMQMALARAECEKFGFSLLVVDTVLSTEAAGTVLTQSPPSGEMRAYGEIIQASVSGGCVIMPDFYGMTRDEALLLAQQKRLNLFEIQEYPITDETMIDRVATQMPARDERVMEGTNVTLAIYVRQTIDATPDAGT